MQPSTSGGVYDLARRFPMSFAAVQKDVAVLKRAGPVTSEKRGREQLVRGTRAARLTRVGSALGHGAGVRPWRRMISPIAAGSGGPPAEPAMSASKSRK